MAPRTESAGFEPTHPVLGGTGEVAIDQERWQGQQMEEIKWGGAVDRPWGKKAAESRSGRGLDG